MLIPIHYSSHLKNCLCSDLFLLQCHLHTPCVYFLVIHYVHGYETVVFVLWHHNDVSLIPTELMPAFHCTLDFKQCITYMINNICEHFCEKPSCMETVEAQLCFLLPYCYDFDVFSFQAFTCKMIRFLKDPTKTAFTVQVFISCRIQV